MRRRCEHHLNWHAIPDVHRADKPRGKPVHDRRMKALGCSWSCTLFLRSAQCWPGCRTARDHISQRNVACLVEGHEDWPRPRSATRPNSASDYPAGRRTDRSRRKHAPPDAGAPRGRRAENARCTAGPRRIAMHRGNGHLLGRGAPLLGLTWADASEPALGPGSGACIGCRGNLRSRGSYCIPRSPARTRS